MQRKKTRLARIYSIASKMHMIENQTPLLTALDAFRRIQPYFEWEQEEVHVVALNSRQGIIDHRMLFRGTIDSCALHPRDLFRFVILSNASAFILFHNHPSGDPTPSQSDIKITLKILKLSKLLEIKFLDHIVLSQNGFMSFKELKII